MTGTETTIIRIDGDNRPVSVNVETGRVERQNSYYLTPLKGEVAWRLFLELAGLIYSGEFPEFIKACNRAAARKTLVTDEERRAFVRQLLGIDPTPVKSAKPHGRGCRCPKCRVAHILGGCRSVHCQTCN